MEPVNTLGKAKMPPFHPFRGTENLGKANSGSTTPRKLDLKNRCVSILQ